MSTNCLANLKLFSKIIREKYFTGRYQKLPIKMQIAMILYDIKIMIDKSQQET